MDTKVASRSVDTDLKTDCAPTLQTVTMNGISPEICADDPKDTGNSSEQHQSTKRWRYGMIIVALCVTSSLVALEGTVVSTALPSIIHDLSGGETYVWVVNAYFLSRFVRAQCPLIHSTAN